jgi:hypothetical protein
MSYNAKPALLKDDPEAPRDPMTIVQDRLDGYYSMKETLDEAKLSVRQMKKDDRVFTVNREHGVFNVYTLKEFARVIQHWQAKDVILEKKHIYKRTLAGKTVYLFIVQPHNLGEVDPGYCPLAASLGVLATGYGYITTHRAVADLMVFNALNKKEKGTKSKYYCDAHPDTILLNDGNGGHYCDDCDEEDGYESP